jgi:hypothetical protein
MQLKHCACVNTVQQSRSTDIIFKFDCSIAYPYDAHALAAPAHDSFDQHRVANGSCFALKSAVSLVFAMIARGDRHTSSSHQSLGHALRAHCVDCRGRRANEDHPSLRTGLSKGRILAEEAIAALALHVEVAVQFVSSTYTC